MISTTDYLWFVNRTLDQMVVVLRQLGDETASKKPGPPQTNSPFGIVTHCLGVMRSWGGYLVAGRTVVRDRETEFTAVGRVEFLIEEIAAARAQLALDVASADLDAPLRNSPSPTDAELPFGQSQGAALFHLYEELSQHLGQLEISRDVLLAQR